jgi:hypothetical protein
MDLKHFMITVLSGIVGTLGMTVVMYMYAAITRHFTKVIHLLGSMLAGDPDFKEPGKNALIVGTLGHFGVGVIFSFAYFLLWNWGIFRIDFADSVLIGAVSGLVAIIVWKSYLTLHHQAPQISQTHFFVALFLAHLVFGMISVNVFQIITDNPELWFELQEDAKLSLSNY